MTRSSYRWVAGASLVLAAGPAWAYIDPGTGSMLVQSALARIAVALMAGRSAWHKVKSFSSEEARDGMDLGRLCLAAAAGKAVRRAR